jgi:hypothetical protein
LTYTGNISIVYLASADLRVIFKKENTVMFKFQTFFAIIREVGPSTAILGTIGLVFAVITALVVIVAATFLFMAIWPLLINRSDFRDAGVSFLLA